MRIALVNDEPVALEALRRVVAGGGEHAVAWTARDGAEAVARCADDVPDVLLMDLLMPVMDGVEATRRIMAASPCAVLVVTADPTRNTSRVFAAMGAGALDVVATPTLIGPGSEASARALLDKIRLVGRLGASRAASEPAGRGVAPGAVGGAMPTALVAIGASAGGPPAVAHVLRDLPADLPLAVLVVQHVDEEFVESMAEWLDSQTQLVVRVAREGDAPESGHVYLAGGGGHLVLRPDGRLGYAAEPRDSLYRPSADALLESVARHWRGSAIGIVLTGMGRDGARGLGALRAAGARTIAQDRDSSAVYGMPKAAVEADAATDILPLRRIGPFVRELLGRATPAAGMPDVSRH